MEGEARWIQAARAGDARAYGELVAAYERPVFNLAYRMLGNAGDAEDAAQESFLKAYRALGSYDPRRPFSTWLLSITAHHCIDRLRRRRMHEVSLDGLAAWRWPSVDAVDPDHSAELADEGDRIQRLLSALTEDYRLIIVLRYWHDLGYEEIAEVTGLTVSAVKSKLHRARNQLAALLGADAHSHPDHRPDTRPAGAANPAPSGGMSPCRAAMPTP